MIGFTFTTDEESHAYCLEISAAMESLFGIGHIEAVMRMNRLWSGLTFGGPEELLFHELPDEWAKDIYYGAESFWWALPDDQRKPLPAP